MNAPVQPRRSFLKISALASLVGSAIGGVAISKPIKPPLAPATTERTVEDFGAVGDGVTNDQPAFLAMYAATGGIIRMMSKAYNVGNMKLLGQTNAVVRGEYQAQPLADFSQLTGGSIMVGSCGITATTAIVEDCGVDSGTGRGYTTATERDGLVINAPLAETGNSAFVRRFSSIGAGDTGTSHGVLIQGFTSGEVDNCYCASRAYGVVVKSHNFNISNISGDYIQSALVFLKSDTSDMAGGVADGHATNTNISNINNRCDPAQNTCSAVYLIGSTLVCSRATVSNVMQSGGFAPLRIQGSGTSGGPYASSVTASGINSDGAQYGFYSGGYTYDWQASNVMASNPTTGLLFYVDAPATNWKITNSGLLISNAGITGTVAGSANGIMGLFDNISVRNPARNMTVSIGSGATVMAGRLLGNIAP